MPTSSDSISLSLSCCLAFSLAFSLAFALSSSAGYAAVGGGDLFVRCGRWAYGRVWCYKTSMQKTRENLGGNGASRNGIYHQANLAHLYRFMLPFSLSRLVGHALSRPNRLFTSQTRGSHYLWCIYLRDALDKRTGWQQDRGASTHEVFGREQQHVCSK